jgi:hypothetical protein
MVEITAKKLGRESTVPGDRYASVKELVEKSLPTVSKSQIRRSVRRKRKETSFRSDRPIHRRSPTCKKRQDRMSARGEQDFSQLGGKAPASRSESSYSALMSRRTPYAPDQSRRPYQFGSQNFMAGSSRAHSYRSSLATIPKWCELPSSRLFREETLVGVVVGLQQKL